MDIIKDTNLKFVLKRKLFYKISAIVILFGIISLLFQGFNYGIDFAGGTLIQLDFAENTSVADIRSVLAEMNLASSTIQTLTNNEFVIRTDQTAIDQRNEILNHIEENVGVFEVLKVEMVGPVIGDSLKQLALMAIIFAFIGIIIYITIRFEFKYAITSIIALGHDVLIALGVLSLLQKEITIPIIAAVLTIVGYSLNNTIVIFDRLRENRKLKTRASLESIIDLSINQSLTRTINTAITTLLPVLALYFFGGTLSDFAFVLLVGITVGTYSSICMAGPLLLELQKRTKMP
ncbi:MAG: protein translocase subunit SecF [Atribacterota bacterium]|nr:protein translocase subunit SecF [Atribacterota bacterium]